MSKNTFLFFQVKLSSTSQSPTTIPVSVVRCVILRLGKLVSFQGREMYFVKIATAWNLGRFARNALLLFPQLVEKELCIGETTIIGIVT